MARFTQDPKVVTVPYSWDTLEQLRRFALSQGCTPAQFDYATEVNGPEVKHVADFLQRRGFVPLPKRKLQVV